MQSKNENYLNKRLPQYPVDGAPPAASMSGRQIYVTNGAGGNPVVAFSDGTNWLRVDTRTPISAT